MKNLALRVTTAVVAVPVVLLLVLWRRPEGAWGLVFSATLVSLYEYFTMAARDAAERWVGIALGAAVAAALYWWPRGLAVALPVLAVLPSFFYLLYYGTGATVGRLGAMTFGVVYGGVLPTFAALLKRDGGTHGASWLLLTFLIAWFSDTIAYFVGRAFGRHKLAAVSPGKTWEGAMGGVVGAAAVAVLANLWFFPELGWRHGLTLVLVGCILGQCGDLVESMIKRACGVKDSGKLFPGHGGMLDRIDAVIFIAPWAYVYMTLLWR